MKATRKILIKGTLVALFGLGLLASQVHGEMIFTILQDGNDVTAVGSGSFDLTALSAASQAMPFAAIRASDSWVGVGAVGANLQHYTGVTGPDQFGLGTDYFLATTSSGDNFMINDYSIFVPLDYVSGAQLDGSATFSNETIAGMGLTEGIYTYTWGSGSSADSATVNIGAIPEPSVIALTAFFGGGIFAVRRIFMI